MVYFGEKSAKIAVFWADVSPKMTKVRPKYVAWGCIQDGVVFTRIRYVCIGLNIRIPLLLLYMIPVLLIKCVT